MNYGKESDYNHYYSTLNIKDIPLKQAISDITLSGFLTIFGGYLAGLAGAAISFAASSGTTLYNYFQNQRLFDQSFIGKRKNFIHIKTIQADMFLHSLHLYGSMTLPLIHKETMEEYKLQELHTNVICKVNQYE